MRYRLLALDVDGTLLDPTGVLRPTVCDAVRAVHQRGLRVMLCTGRRFRTAQPIAQALQLDGPIVVHNGALVKDVATGHTLQQQSLPAMLYQQALDLLRSASTPMAYVDALHARIDIVTEPVERAHPFQQEYLSAHLTACQIVEDMTQSPAHGVLRMGVMADTPRLEALYPLVQTRVGTQGRVHLLMNKNYQGSILEVLRAGVSKWQALAQIAQASGIAPAEILAVGDDHNDIDMLCHAGMGIAMGNAPDTVKAAAHAVTGSNAEDGLVQALERYCDGL